MRELGAGRQLLAGCEGRSLTLCAHCGYLGIDPGKRLHDAVLPNSEPKLREIFGRLAGRGPVLVVVDQPATIGALPVAVARACGHDVGGYLPGLAMRRTADLYPGKAKTDARDAFVIADAARTLPHTLRRVDVGDDTLAELEVLVSYDDDLVGEATRISNRIRGLLTGIHPALERVLGPKIAHPAVLEILSRCGGPTGITYTRSNPTPSPKEATLGQALPAARNHFPAQRRPTTPTEQQKSPFPDDLNVDLVVRSSPPEASEWYLRCVEEGLYRHSGLEMQ